MRVSEAINKKILKLAEERGMTVNGFCTFCGIPQSTVHNLLSCKNKSAKITTITKICEGINMELYEFFKDPLFKNLDPED